MDSDNDSYHFPKCLTHAYTRFENGCSENSTQKLLTKYSTGENNKRVICRPRSVRIGKNCALGLARFFPIRTSRPANNIYVIICRVENLFDRLVHVTQSYHTLPLSLVNLSTSELSWMTNLLSDVLACITV